MMLRVPLALALILSASTAVAEFIPGSDIASGHWSGGAYTDDVTGAFSHCVVSAAYVSGDELFMSVNGDASVTVGVFSAHFNLNIGDTFPVTLQIDRRNPFSGTATAQSAQFATLVLPDLESALTALRRGRTLVIYSFVGESSFDLTGTSRALSETLDCAINYLNYVGKPTEPAVTAATPTAPTIQPAAIPHGTLDQIARQLVQDFGIKDAAFYTAEELKDYMTNDSAVFSSTGAGLLGGVMAASIGQAPNLKASDPDDIAFLTSGCEGESSTSSRALNVTGFDSREVMASCQMPNQRSDSVMAKTLIGNDILYTFFVFDGTVAYTAQEQKNLSDAAAQIAAALATGQPLTAPPAAPSKGPAIPPRRTVGN